MHQRVKALLSLILVFQSFSVINAQEYQYPSDYAASLIGKNQLEEAVSFCNKAISEEVLKKPMDSIEVAFLHVYLSRAYAHQSGEANYLAAIKASEAGITYCPSSDDGISQRARMYNDKALYEFSTNLQYRSFQSNLKALELFESVKKPDYNYMINIYIDMSRTSVYNGNIEEAKRLLRQGERLYARHKAIVDKQRNYSTIGKIASYEFLLPYNKIYQLTELGQSRKDSIAILKSLKKIEELSKNEDFLIGGEGMYVTVSLNEVADWIATRNSEESTTTTEFNEALSLVNRAIGLVEQEEYGGVNYLYVFKYNRSKFLMMLNRFQEALLAIDEVIQTTPFTSVNTPTFFAQKGRIRARQKEKDSALHNFQIAIQNIHQGKDSLKSDFSNFKPSNIFKHNEVLHTIAEDLTKNFPQDESVKKIVAQIYKIGLLQFEASYDKRKYNKRQDLYLRRIFNGLIKTKGWGYNEDILYPNLLNRYETIKNTLVWTEFYQNRKTDNLEGLETLLSEKRILLTAIAEAQNDNNIKVQDSLQTLLELSEYKLNNAYPNANLLSEINFEVNELQQELTDKQCVLKYILLEEELATIKITKDKIDIVLSEWNYNKLVESLRLATINNNQEQLNELSTQLGKVIIPKIDEDCTSLIVNPDGILTQLPWELIKIDGRYLIEDYDIHYTSNLGFVFPKTKTNNQKELLAIYTPNYPESNKKFVTRSAPVFLEGAQNEARLISNYFTSEIYKDNLSKTLFKETAPSASLLHLAMHAEINTINSGLNRLLFDDDSDSDKNLSLEEIYGMKLSANLAVLSACNTGFGNDNDGRGMESFQRAFTFAGVPATVASLWEVPDIATKEIMVGFYENLKKGQTKADALKNAKLNYIENHNGTKLSQPYYWAGFVLYGDDSPVVDSSNTWIWLLSILVLIVLTVFLFKRSN